VLGFVPARCFRDSGRRWWAPRALINTQLAHPDWQLPLLGLRRIQCGSAVCQCLGHLAAAWLGVFRDRLASSPGLPAHCFAAICGSSVATALAMGTILIPACLAGYLTVVRIGVVGASGHRHGIARPAAILTEFLAEQSVPLIVPLGVLRLRQAAPRHLSVRGPPPHISSRTVVCRSERMRVTLSSIALAAWCQSFVMSAFRRFVR